MARRKATPEKFPAALRRLRDARGLTQQQLADEVGVSRPAIARMEKGASRPSLDVLRELVVALGCDADELIGKES